MTKSFEIREAVNGFTVDVYVSGGGENETYVYGKLGHVIKALKSFFSEEEINKVEQEAEAQLRV